MLVSLSTLTFDLDGHVYLTCAPDTTHGETRRRMNRIATLDGGAAFNDFGVSESDRVFDLRWKPMKDEAKVQRLLTLYLRLRLSTPEGVWIVAPEVYTPGADESQLRLLAVAKITED